MGDAEGTPDLTPYQQQETSTIGFTLDATSPSPRRHPAFGSILRFSFTEALTIDTVIGAPDSFKHLWSHARSIAPATMSSSHNLRSPSAKPFQYFLEDLNINDTRQIGTALRAMKHTELTGAMAQHGVISVGVLKGTSREVHAAWYKGRIYLIATPFKAGLADTVSSSELRNKCDTPGQVPFMLVGDWDRIEFSHQFEPGLRLPGETALRAVFRGVEARVEGAMETVEERLDKGENMAMAKLKTQRERDEFSEKLQEECPFDEDKHGKWFQALSKGDFLT